MMAEKPDLAARELEALRATHNLDGLVVLAVRGDAYQVVGWGKTMQQFNRFDRVADDVLSAVENEHIDISE
ncbi:MAG TPA: hypothetical protein VM487_03240 [Phycisphaerae bacterium]|nr:hypothetical protein [Phycisphaerae bacterium]